MLTQSDRRIWLTLAPLDLPFYIVLSAACLTFRQVTAHLPNAFLNFPAIWEISVLQLWIWYELIFVAHHNSKTERVSKFLLAIFFVAFTCCLCSYPDSSVGFMVIATVIFSTRLKKDVRSKVFVGSFCIIIASGFLASSLFATFHSTWARVDSYVLWRALTAFGIGVSINETVLHLLGSSHSIIVEATCSSSWVSILPVSCFIIVTLCRYGRIEARDIVRLVIVIFVIFLLNLFRLAEMLPSRESWEYWHFGTGSSLFAVSTALVVLALVRSGKE